MKDMKSKIIILILVVPLLLIFVTGSVVHSTELFVDVPVTSIEIQGERTRQVDISSDERSFRLETIVLPENATNPKVTYSVEEVEGQKKAQVDISDDGLITAHTIGTVNIVAYADGKSDSITVNFYSSKPTGIKQEINEINIEVGKTVQIERGIHYNIEPDTIQTQINWSSDSPETAAVNNGLVSAKGSGKALITAKIAGIIVDEDGLIKDTDFEMKFLVNVSVDMPETGVSINGETEGTLPLYTNNINQPKEYIFQYDSTKINLSEIELVYPDEFSKVELEEVPSDGDYKNAKIKVAFGPLAKKGETYQVLIKKDGELLATFNFSYALMTKAELAPESTNLVVSKNDNVSVTFTVITDSDEMYGYDSQNNLRANSYNVKYTSSNPEVIKVISSDNLCIATPLQEGTATIKAIITDRATGDVIIQTSKEFTVYNPYTLLSFGINTVNYGLARELALGRYDLEKEGNSYKLVQIEPFQLPIEASTIKGKVPIDYSLVTIESSDPEIASVSSDAKLTLNDKSGLVTITVKYNGYGSTVQAKITLNCRSEGVNVTDYDELMWTTKKKIYETVLKNDIMLAPIIAEKKGDTEFGFRSYANSCVTTINPTADTTFYKNKSENIKIKYAVEFYRSVYGNGYFIDADNLTQKLYDYAGFRIFSGPIDLVRWGNGTETMAVKSQDHIIFLVREDNVEINNIELKGCSDSSMVATDENGNNVTDLGKLDYCGTVLEVAGDNCKISYSRINNGRTVVRAYGRANDLLANVEANPEDYKVNINIKNSLLSYGREFILKIGTNQHKRISPDKYQDFGIGYLNKLSEVPSQEVFDEASPYLLKEDGTNYIPGDVANINDKYFNDNYVLTNVTLENSAFRNAGLFSIGLESIFGGLCLHRYDYSDVYAFATKLHWGKVSGASYPAALNLKGDVRFYDWKQVNSLNSETLLEGSDTQVAETIGFKMDFVKLIKSYDSSLTENKLLQSYDGEKYVNGAIAFYGGGKNYSYVDISEVSDEFHSLAKYQIPVSFLIEEGRERFIKYTAGVEPFRFLLYNSNSTLDVQKQINDFSSGQALNWLYRKIK